MTTETVLLVDDEQDLREIVSWNLEQAGYSCLTAKDGVEARQVLLSEKAVDLLLLDVMMPRMSGFELVQLMRQNDYMGHLPPIIFLTALGEESDLLRGFELGADDYIIKPFSVREVLARVAAVLKRYVREVQPASGCPILFDEAIKQASLDGTPMELTKIEYELLYFFSTHQGVVFSRNDLLQSVWPDNGLVLDRTVDVTVNRLRKKLGKYKDFLSTKIGYGYYFSSQ